MPVGPLFLTFTVPDGWAFDNRGGSETGISSASDPWQKYIDFMYDIYPLRGTWPACGAQTDWESPHTARDFVDYLEARPDWSGTATRTRIGGLTGWRLDGEFQASPCTIDYTVRWSDNIPTSVGVGPGPWDVYVLDDGSGSTLLLEVKGDTEFIDSAQSVIDTFEFSNQPPPSATPTPFAAGPYTTLAWQPQVTLTVPEGWVVTRDESNALALASTSDARHKVEVLRNAYQPNPSCGFADDWFSPHTALEFIHKLQARPNWYGTSTPAFVGGLEGWQVDGVLDFEGCETRYTVPSSVGAPTRQNQLGRWTFYVLDESGSTILLSADDGDSPDAAAQSVFDSFHFADAPPARCDELSPVPSAPTSTPGNDRLDLESAFWLDPTDGYRYVVVGTGRDQSVAADVEVTLTNACGATEQDIVNLGTLKPGETHAALASVNPGFVPVRIDVHQSLTYQLKTLPAADCNRRPDGQDRDGQATVRGVISTTPYLVDLYFDAVAIFRNRTGAVVGADKVSLLHPGTGTQATEFEIPPSTVWPDAVSTDFVCYPTAFHW